MDSEDELKEIAVKICKKKHYYNPTFAGKGAFKETYLVQDVSGNNFALKIINNERQSIRRTEREINALLRCSCDYICRIYDHGLITTKAGMSYTYSLEEYLDGGTLTEKNEKKQNTPNDVKKYGFSMAHAIACLKELNLVHRDIKPDNIMFRKKNNSPILVDLGLVRDLSRHCRWSPIAV